MLRQLVFIFILSWFIFSCKKDDSSPAEIIHADYYVATYGDDNNTGTSVSKPFATWQKAFDMAAAGDTVYIRGGIYYPDDLSGVSGVRIDNKSGNLDEFINIWAYPGERPILDVSVLVGTTSTNHGIMLFNCAYWHLKGLEVRGASQQYGAVKLCYGILIRNCNEVTLEQMVSHDNQGPGISVHQNQPDTDTVDNVLVLNCDAYNNYDFYSEQPGQHGDGINIVYTYKGTTNTASGCRSWNNSDDGFDSIVSDGIVIFTNCWSWLNGRGEFGNGDGFKLGDLYHDPEAYSQRIVTNCIAYNNRNHGFDQNGNNGAITLYNNVAFGNQYYGFELSHDNTGNIFKNNIADNNYPLREFDVAITMNSVNEHNSWNISPSFQWNDGTNYRAKTILPLSNFISTDPKGIDAPRHKDGSLPDIDFLKLAPESSYIDAGADVGLFFLGLAPDMGPFEKN